MNYCMLLKLYGIGVTAHAILPKIALRMHSGKFGRFHCLISLYGGIVENRETSNFSSIYLTFRTNVI